MFTFLLGIVILFIGAGIYGQFVEKIFKPDIRSTPALNKKDNIDFIPMKKSKSGLIHLLNIAGVGPIIGPIQGALFGPIAFITIPIGCIIAGATHDYFTGMISIRNGGAQMPFLVQRYLGKFHKKIYTFLLWFLLLIVGVVFTYTPADLIVKDIFGFNNAADSIGIWIAYAGILLYYLLVTVFPLDAIISKIYPFFTGLLIVSSLAIFGSVLLNGANLQDLNMEPGIFAAYFSGQSFIPFFFVTVTCGILSGFHGSQCTLIARTIHNETEGRRTFYNMMIAEGFIAMCWAAGAMIVLNRGIPPTTTPTDMVGIISKEFLGNWGGIIVLLGVTILPLTSGDTAFRSLRMMITEEYKIDQSDTKKRMTISLLILLPAIIILVLAKILPGGFSFLWRYFGFFNQIVAIFSLAVSTVYLWVENKIYWVTLLPGMFYTFVATSFITHTKLGLFLNTMLGLPETNQLISYTLGIAAAFFYYVLIKNRVANNKSEIKIFNP